VLLHCISADTPDCVEVYSLVRKELESYSDQLASKEEYILLTKTDLVSPEDLANKKALFEKMGKQVLTVSIIDDNSIKNLSDFLVNMLQKGD